MEQVRQRVLNSAVIPSNMIGQVCTIPCLDFSLLPKILRAEYTLETPNADGGRYNFG